MMNAVVRRSSAANPNVLTRLLRGVLIKQLAGLQRGGLVLRDALGTEQFGKRSSDQDDSVVLLQVLDLDFYRAVAARGSVGAGEAYMDGSWRCNNLVGLVQLLVRNRELLDGMETGLAWFGGALLRAWYAFRRNTRIGSQRNVAAHYDLGNDFFRLFLSSDMMYSSALWVAGDDSLEAASTRKLETICRRLQLKPGEHVLEIGAGWGSFAVFAAAHYGCRVTTTTISREQFELAKAKVAEAGLSEKVIVLLKDYRDLEGQYDKLVSIEMVEAIGAQYLDCYFSQLSKLLKPEGLALLQAITIEDHRYQQALTSVDFIKRHVFPGSFMPSIYALLEAKTRSSDLTMIEQSDFGDSYAKTLRVWRERFLTQRDNVRAQGFDERFIRMWEFYLAYCEGGFRERSIGVSHLLFAKPGYRAVESAHCANIVGHSFSQAMQPRSACRGLADLPPLTAVRPTLVDWRARQAGRVAR